MQTKSLLRKGLVIGIIVLLAIASVSPSLSKSLNSSKKKENLNFNIKNINSPFNHPAWQWAVNGGGTSYDEGYRLSVDSCGNTYVTGFFTGTATFGSTTLTSQGHRDLFIAKLSTTGVWQWAVRAGGGYSDDYGEGIAVDASGSSYITGCFWGTASFGSTNLTSQGYRDVFVAKLDTNGNWLWAVCGGGTGDDYGAGVAVDANGNAYITGYFWGTETFGTTVLTSQGMGDVFIAKITTNGAWQWAVRAGGTSDNDEDYSNNICVDASGNIYITGYFWGTAWFGSTIITSNGNYDAFMAKANSNGDWQWAVNAGGPHYDYGSSICVDANGDPYFTGFFLGTVLFGSTLLTSSGSYDVFVAKLDTYGNWLWAVRAGGGQADEGFDICVDSNSNAYITGFFYAYASFGSIVITSSGDADVFVAKLNSSGDWQWAVQAGGTYDDEGYGICVDSIGNTYVTGWFLENSSFGSTTIISYGNEDVFVAKLSNDTGNQPPVASFTWSPQTPTPGQSITFDASTSYDSDGYIALYEWDWNNDGVYEESHSSPTAIHAWATAGSYPVTVRVTDDDGATGTITKTVSVNGTVDFNINITGGFGISADITNNGTINATNIQWKFTLAGGFILLGKTNSGTVASLAPRSSATVKDKPILGFGKTTIKIDVSCAERVSATQTKTGTVILFFVLKVK